MTVTSKKLIEVALPLEAINEEGALRKRKAPSGYPTTLHKWWAQRPVAAARGVIFAQMVDDPSSYLDELRGDDKLRRKAERELKKRLNAREVVVAEFEQATRVGLTMSAPGPEPTLDDVLAEFERERLFKIIKDLILWENTTDESLLTKARGEIWQSWRRACARNADNSRAAELFDRHSLPPFHDVFAGSGALPLEAQRLGLEAHASDLNPVAVLINKAMIEIPPKFAGRPPVHPPEEGQTELPREWKGAHGLAEDVRSYGQWMRDEAEKRIGHLYPKVEITAEMVRERPDLKQYLGQRLTAIAWIWARTVKSPNPAFSHVDVPLASTFMLSSKAGKEVYVQPVIEGDSYRFAVRVGKPKNAETAKNGTKSARANFNCLMSGVLISGDYIKAEGQNGRMGSRLMAIVAEGQRGRVYLAPNQIHESIPAKVEPVWRPEGDVPARLTGGTCVPYGMTTWGDLFTPRQLRTLTTLSDLVVEVRDQVIQDAKVSGLPDDGLGLEAGGTGALAYAEALATYLALATSRVADYGSSLATWRPKDNAMRSTMPKQAIQMTWDYAEGSPFGSSSSGFLECATVVSKALKLLPCNPLGVASQQSARDVTLATNRPAVVSTDPPYYDNIGYADLSDFYYAWLRRSLRTVFPSLFATLAVPKAEEFVAMAYRHGGRDNAEKFFVDGMTQAMTNLVSQSHPEFPVTIYYAYKQSETEDESGTTSTGWETFLSAINRAGLAVSGTWPINTEGDNRQVGIGTNALASSIVLVCRPKSPHARAIVRRDFIEALKRELPQALRLLQAGNIAPVDLAQAAIGPGMGVFSRYAQVLDAEGKALTIHDVLTLIIQTLDEVTAEQEGDFDADTRWALAWFEQSGFDEGEYGVAETLSKAKNTSVMGMVQAGIVASSRGKVRLLKPAELPDDWEPANDARLTAWEGLHHLIRVLESGGEGGAAELVRTLGSQAEVARELAYRLFTVCERHKRAAEALSYNALVQSWPEIMRLTQQSHAEDPEQGRLL